MASLFGGPSKTNVMTGGQQNLHDDIVRTARREFGQGADVYQGQRVADTNRNINQAYSNMGNAAAPIPGMAGAMGDILSGAGNPDEVRSAFEGQLAPAQLEFKRMLNEVTNKYGDVNGASGPMADMMGRSTAEYGMGLNNLLGQMTLNDQNQARDRQVGGVNAATNARAGNINAANSMYNMGAAQQGQDQQGLAAEFAKWSEGQWTNNPALGLIGPALGTNQFAMGQEPGIVPGITGLIGGVGSVAAPFVEQPRGA
jgi:hypothetical protein